MLHRRVMSKSTHKLRVTKPKNAFTKSLQLDVKEVFLALSKGIGHTAFGKWEEVGNDAANALSAIGLATEPEELAFLLLRRALTRALFDLVGESANHLNNGRHDDPETLLADLDFGELSAETEIDRKFLENPVTLPLVSQVQTILERWLARQVSNEAARSVSGRFPGYFVYALNSEWVRNAKSYRPLIDALKTPFVRAGEREWAWAAYSALLKRRIHEGVFAEPFGLEQMYVQPHAFFVEELPPHGTGLRQGVPKRRRTVVSLRTELHKWLDTPSPHDAMRVISGGPGSGKSSFARVFAAEVSARAVAKVLYVPLHLIDPSRDLVDEIGRFVRDEGVLPHNPLDADASEQNLLIIFDGLDELASQGKAAAETARSFVTEVERTIERRNLQSVRLRVLISGRELVVQENESEFRKPRQVLTLLPYTTSESPDHSTRFADAVEGYFDPEKLLEKDLRQAWWKKYGSLTGKGFVGVPEPLMRDDLTEITAQPLLNYLVALSFTRKRIDFSKDINLNAIYGDLVGAVHERAYEKGRTYAAIKHMSAEEFSRVLEEIGLAAWHGDGRSTTVREIEDHCRTSGVGTLLDAFKDGAKAGVTRLLAAFFFRKYGQRSSGDATFVFTHKSFGEYLAARRIVRAIERIVRELDRRSRSADEGWDEKDALRHWVQICGPSPISSYLHAFLLSEVKLRDSVELSDWQGCLTNLLGYLLRQGLPMEQLQLPSFRDALFQARNAEEALLVALNSCARVTGRVSALVPPDPTAFGAWFRRIQGQRTGPEPSLAARCLSHLDLTGSALDISDFYGADLSHTDLRGAHLNLACFGRADLSHSRLVGARLFRAFFEDAKLDEAGLAVGQIAEKGARRSRRGAAGAPPGDQPDLTAAKFRRAVLERADLREANLRRTNLQGADLRGADLRNADLRDAVYSGAKFSNQESAQIFQQQTLDAMPDPDGQPDPGDVS